ncbi:MAG: U32 family peptidase [Candidatus Omnitrophota bacterium]
MKLTVPHNWQKDLLGAIDFGMIGEFYAKLDSDIMGGGRASNICPDVSKKFISQEINKIHARNTEFNYLLNATCLDNQELSQAMLGKLSRLTDWLVDINVDSVTVAMPYILGFIKKNYPGLKVCVSTMAQVDTPDKAKFWEDLGADKITLYEINVNRDFNLIEKIRNTVKCSLQLIANNGCLYSCPFTVNHGLLCSHASQSNHRLKGFIIDFYRIYCSYLRIKDPANYIRADWIRPEDIHYYEDLGINSIKIVNRGMSTPALKMIVEAYTRGSFEGNLLDLLPGHSKNINFKKHGIVYLFKYFFHPRFVNVFKLVSMKKIFEDKKIDVFIDNKKLEGFLMALQEKQCGQLLCSDCGWCVKVASQVIEFDRPKSLIYLKELESFLNDFIEGSIFKYI